MKKLNRNTKLKTKLYVVVWNDWKDCGNIGNNFQKVKANQTLNTHHQKMSEFVYFFLLCQERRFKKRTRAKG